MIQKLKSYLEDYFSMPFDVSASTVDGEVHYVCCPQNEGQLLFEVKAFIHSSIRLIIEINPQRHGGNTLCDMARATPDKQKNFFTLWQLLADEGIRGQFLVNNVLLSSDQEWPKIWRSFSCKLCKVPIPEGEYAGSETLLYWVKNAFDLVFTLLNIVDIDDSVPIQTEGTKQDIQSIRYERNHINRLLCLRKKGYNCTVCGMNFEDVYGIIGRHFIEVHHTTPVSVMGEGYVLDIDRDLVPLCSNCHSMIHKKFPPYSVDELRNIMMACKETSSIVNMDSRK